MANKLSDILQMIHNTQIRTAIDKLGVMTTVIADKGLQLDADQEVQIPQFDPSIFVAIGLYTVDGTGDSIWGTTDDNAQCTERQIIGPVFPHADQLDKN